MQGLRRIVGNRSLVCVDVSLKVRLFKYTDESLKKWPWLWKYDVRFKRGCRYQGHRYSWRTAIRRRTYIVTIGTCLRCAALCRAALFWDDAKRTARIVRCIDKSQPVTLTAEQFDELVRQLQLEKSGKDLLA